MKGPTHIAAGTLAGLILSQAICPEQSTQAIAVIAITAAGSIMPDIDVGTSKLGRRIPALSYTIQFLFGHRGIFHSLILWALPLLYLHISYPEYRLFVWSCGCGIATHLLLDMLNPAGIPLLWPWNKRIHLAEFQSGGLFDWLLGIALTVLTLSVLFDAI